MADAMAMEVTGVISPKGLVGRIKELFESLKNDVAQRIDDAKTRKAERKYESVRERLISNAAGYTEKEYKRIEELANQFKDLSPAELRAALERIQKGKIAQAGKNIGEGRFSAVMDCANKILNIFSEIYDKVPSSVLGGMLACAGVVSAPWLQIALAAFAGMGLVHKIRKSINSKKVADAERLVGNREYMQAVQALIEDIKKLKERVEQDRQQWVQIAKSKKYTQEEYDKKYAEYLDKLIGELNLKNIDRRVLQEQFGLQVESTEKTTEESPDKETVVEEVEEKDEDVKEDENEVEVVELTEDQKKQQEEQRRLAEEQRLREEEERKRQEEENVVEEERE